MLQRVARSPLVFLLVLVSTGAHAAEPEGVVVSRLEAKSGVTEQDIDSLSGLLSAEVEKHARGKVTSDADVRALLQADERKKLCGGLETSCLAEIGGALGVPEVISGDLGRVGLIWIFNLRRIDVSRAVTLRRVGRQVKGDISNVVEALPIAVASLYAKDEPAQQGPEALAGSIEKEQAAAAKDWRWARWPALAGGAACLALGAVGTWQMGVAVRDYDKGVAGNGDATSRHDTWRLVSVASYVAGGLLLATGAVLWLSAPAAGSGATGKGLAAAVSVLPLADGALVAVEGSWR